MEKLTDDLNIILNLADRPTQNATELKSEFDKAVNIIKEYLNNTVHPTVEGMLADLGNKVGSSQFETLKKGFEELIENKLKEVDDTVQRLTNSAINYRDFEITITDPKTLDHGNGGIKTDTQTIEKEGYFPLGIVGCEVSGVVSPSLTSEQPNVLSKYLSNRVVGSCKTNVKISYANNDAWTYKTTYKLHILWTKVKETV